MKRSIALAVALAVSGILLSLASSDSVSQAQQRRLFQWDTGVVSLGPNQVLRLLGDWNGDGDATDAAAKRPRRLGIEIGGFPARARAFVTAGIGSSNTMSFLLGPAAYEATASRQIFCSFALSFAKPLS